MNIGFPYAFDFRGRTAGARDPVRELIEQVLFTSPGERINRPDFGTGLMALVFAPLSDELATTVQFIVQGALQQWLGDLIQVEEVQVEKEDSTLVVTIRYIVRRTQERAIARFAREGTAQ